jgi:colanic acid biosynthesis protein WcaH
MTHPKHLDDTQFKVVVRDAPLVSIDLVPRDTAGRALLGLRRNAPARGYWFVPGGRIMKDESLDDAFARIANAELHMPLTHREAIFLGVYEHLYADNVFEEPGFGTHYIVLAYEVAVRGPLGDLPSGQHSEYKWWSTPDLLASDVVHANTKAYFQGAKKQT